jgi:hypothetical protein
MFTNLLKYTLNLQFFAADTGNGGATTEGNQQPTDSNVGGNAQQQEPQNQQQDSTQSKSFSQEDVNNLIAKEKKKATEKFLKELGIDDFENAKEGLQKFKEWQESQKTEAEKQAEKLQTLETENGTLTEENKSLKAQLSALKAGVNAESVEDVVVLAQKYVSDEVDFDTAVQKVLEKYPHFKGQQEEPQEPSKPTFLTGQHQTQGHNNDPFAAKLAKYQN